LVDAVVPNAETHYDGVIESSGSSSQTRRSTDSDTSPKDESETREDSPNNSNQGNESSESGQTTDIIINVVSLNFNNALFSFVGLPILEFKII